MWKGCSGRKKAEFESSIGQEMEPRTGERFAKQWRNSHLQNNSLKHQIWCRRRLVGPFMWFQSRSDFIKSFCLSSPLLPTLQSEVVSAQRQSSKQLGCFLGLNLYFKRETYHCNNNYIGRGHGSKKKFKGEDLGVEGEVEIV